MNNLTLQEQIANMCSFIPWEFQKYLGFFGDHFYLLDSLFLIQYLCIYMSILELGIV